MLEVEPEFLDVRRRILLEKSEAVIPGPLAPVKLTVGEGAVWALEGGRGQVTRIEPATGEAQAARGRASGLVVDRGRPECRLARRPPTG